MLEKDYLTQLHNAKTISEATQIYNRFLTERDCGLDEDTCRKIEAFYRGLINGYNIGLTMYDVAKIQRYLKRLNLSIMIEGHIDYDKE